VAFDRHLEREKQRENIAHHELIGRELIQDQGDNGFLPIDRDGIDKFYTTSIRLHNTYEHRRRQAPSMHPSRPQEDQGSAVGPTRGDSRTCFAHCGIWAGLVCGEGECNSVLQDQGRNGLMAKEMKRDEQRSGRRTARCPQLG
jgi:hypothetical protein